VQQEKTAQSIQTIATIPSNISQTFPMQSTPVAVSSYQLAVTTQPLTISLSSNSMSLSADGQKELLSNLPPVGLSSSDLSALGASGLAAVTGILPTLNVPVISTSSAPAGSASVGTTGYTLMNAEDAAARMMAAAASTAVAATTTTHSTGTKTTAVI